MTKNCPDFDDEATDPGFNLVLSRLRQGDYNHIQAISLVRQGRNLAQGNEGQLLELRRTLLSIFGRTIGNESRVVLNFADERNSEVTLFV